MKIVIYDDMPVHVDIIVDLITAYSIRTDEELLINRMSKASDLMDTTPGCDLLILDIMLENNINGIEIAKTLRKNGYKKYIALVTSSEEYALSGYEIEAFRYILKPIKEQAFFSMLDEVLSRLNKKEEKLAVTFNGVKSYIDICDIIYIESRKMTRYIYTELETFPTKQNIAELEPLLPNVSFSAPHKSYLINLQYVKSISAGKVVLQNNVEIVITRSFKDSFTIALQKYISIRRGSL